MTVGQSPNRTDVANSNQTSDPIKQADDLLRWGRVRGPHALRGWMRISAFAPQLEAPTFRKIHIGGEESTDLETYDIVEMRAFKDGVLVRLDGYDGIEVVDRWKALKGSLVWVLRDELPPLEEEEYYFDDLIGLMAVGPDGLNLGKISDVEQRGESQATLVIYRGSHSDRVPFHDAYVGDVSLAEGKVYLKADPIKET